MRSALTSLKASEDAVWRQLIVKETLSEQERLTLNQVEIIREKDLNELMGYVAVQQPVRQTGLVSALA